MEDYGKISQKTHIALICESRTEHFLRDLSTAAIFLFLWSVGHFADSAALEWVGVAFGGVVLFGRALLIFKGSLDKRMTPNEAREWLDKRFPKTPEECRRAGV